VFKKIPEGKWSYGSQGKRWLDNAENDLKRMGVGGWRKIARNPDARKLILKKAKVLRGPYSQWKERQTERESMRTKAELLFQRQNFHFCMPTTFLPINLCNLSHH
jgi:hypothetical protein